MKLLFGGIALSLLLALAGCGQGGGGNSDGDVDPQIGDVTQSECLSEGGRLATRDLDSGEGDATVADRNPVSARFEGEVAVITHHGAVYPCNAAIEFSMEREGTNIILREINTTDLVTSCICPIDLSVEISRLALNVVYHVEVWDEWKSVFYGSVDIVREDCHVECRTDADCWNVDYAIGSDDCQGGFACIAGKCEYRCDPNMYCHSDADCPAGWYCAWDYPMPLEGNAGAADGTDPATGLPYYECLADSDCPAGMWCELQTNCWPPTEGGCAAYGFCRGEMPPLPEGQCRPMDSQCQTSRDCFDLPAPYRCPGFWTCDMAQCVYHCGEPGGCLSDIDCPAGYACVVPPIGVAEADAAAGAADRMPPDACACYEIYKPVCGIDGITYPNDCYARCAGIAIGYEGECQNYPVEGFCVPVDPGQCQSDRDCGPGFHCEFYYADGTPGSEGGGSTEPGVPRDCMCDQMYAPVCGEDGVTYGNECEAFCAGVRPAYKGECETTGQYGVCVPDVIDQCSAMGGSCEPFYYNSACPPGTTEAWADVPLCGLGAVCCVPSGIPCATDRDCPQLDLPSDPTMPASRMACINGVCQRIDDGCYRYECQSDGDCPAQHICTFWGSASSDGQYCEGSTCVPFDQGICTFDQTVCGPGERCIDGRCVADDCQRDAAGNCQCGGFAGFICPPGLECVFRDPNCDPATGGADCMGICVAPSCACPEYYRPVCGTDGRTYDNPCFAECAGAGILKDGECGPCPPIEYEQCAEGEERVCGINPDGCQVCHCQSRQIYCMSGNDCPAGTICTSENGECLTPPWCRDPDMACPAVCYGICQMVEPPVGGECGNDADCPRYMFCNSCPSDPNCPACTVCGPPRCEYLPD